MTNKIKPAMTMKEWNEGKIRLSSSEEALFGTGILQVRSYRNDSYVEVTISDDQTLIGLAAAANDALGDNDPRKITREMVDALRRACKALDLEHGWPGGDDEGIVPQLADALESYLPLE